MHFLGGGALPAESPVAHDFSATLNALPPAAVAALAELALRALRRDASRDLLAECDAVAASAGQARAAQLAAARAALRSLLLALSGAQKHSLSGAQLREDLGAAPLSLEAARADALAAAWERAAPGLAMLAADRATLGAGAGGALVDAELRFGVTVSTDDVARVGQTFVQLRLSTTKAPGADGGAGGASARAGGGSGGGGLEHRHLEMSVPMLYQLLSALESAQGYVDNL